LEKYGYIGVALFNSLSTIKNLKIQVDKFLKCIVDFYYRNFEKNTGDSIFIIKKIIKALPKLPVLYSILNMKLISRKEMLPFKVIIDIYAHYLTKYDLPEFKVFQNEYIPVAMLFYSNLTYDDIKYLYNSLNSNENRELYDILVVRMGSVIKKTKGTYLKYLEELKCNISHLARGMDLTKFCK
jgi:hypothetical protein